MNNLSFMIKSISDARKKKVIFESTFLEPCRLHSGVDRHGYLLEFMKTTPRALVFNYYPLNERLRSKKKHETMNIISTVWCCCSPHLALPALHPLDCRLECFIHRMTRFPNSSPTNTFEALRRVKT